jgi:hypothetical protein
MDQSIIISVNHLTKFYGKTLGVQDLNFSVSQGEILGYNFIHQTLQLLCLLPTRRPHDRQSQLFAAFCGIIFTNSNMFTCQPFPI